MIRISTLELAILELLRSAPGSGYSLGKIFSETPLGIYSDSPGAIYPALRRLSRRGLISGSVRPGRTGRPSRTAPSGALAAPITPDDVARRMPEVMLRFAFMDRTLPPARIQTILSELERQIRGHIAGLKAFRRRHADHLLPCGRLAFESGIRDYENRARWARRAAARPGKSPAKGA